jgi:hypothetical protein
VLEVAVLEVAVLEVAVLEVAVPEVSRSARSSSFVIEAILASWSTFLCSLPHRFLSR